MKTRPTYAVAGAALLTIIVIGSYATFFRAANPGYAEFSGIVRSEDTSLAQTDGPIIFRVAANSGATETVHLDTGESSCDRTAITPPAKRIGADVAVAGVRGPDGIVRVCEPGTYIR